MISGDFSSTSWSMLPSQVSKSQPHDGAAAAAAVQWITVSVMAWHHCTCGEAGGADSATGCAQLWRWHGHPSICPHQEGKDSNGSKTDESSLLDTFIISWNVCRFVDSWRKEVWLCCSEWLCLHKEYRTQKGLYWLNIMPQKRSWDICANGAGAFSSDELLHQKPQDPSPQMFHWVSI